MTRALRPEPIPALTGLRFFAAAQVVLFHLFASIPTLNVLPVAKFVGSGFVGVTFFFALSGFVLAYNYVTPGREGIGGLRRFFVARFARIYCVYALGVLIALPIFVRELQKAGSHAAEGIGTLTLVMTLLQAWVPASACRLNCPGWSLSAEMFFYLLFPLLAIPLAKMSVRRLLAACAVCWSISLGLGFLYMALKPDGPHPISALSDGMWINVLRYNPLVRLPEFVMGMAVGVMFLQRDRSADARAARWSMPVVLAVLVVLVLSNAIPYPLLHNGLLAPLFAALIFVLAADRGWLGRLLATRTMQLLGEASFALYILHVPYFVWFKKASALAHANIDHSWLLPVVYVLTVQLLALGVFLYIEEPARKAIRRQFSYGVTTSVVTESAGII